MTVQTPEQPYNYKLTLSAEGELGRGNDRNPAEVQFWARVDRSAGSDGCWPWMGYREPKNGYGRVRGFETAYAHRIAYRLAVGPIPPRMDVCHACDNPPCCNPAHLWVGTHADNIRDARDKGRLNSARGERSGQSKLTEAQVRAIRQQLAAGDSERTIANRYGVSQPTIHFIATGATWGWLDAIPADAGGAA